MSGNSELPAGGVLLDRSFRKESPNSIAFPHPQSRKHKYGKEDKPSRGGVLGNVLEWTINITGDRNGKDDVNPAKNNTFGALLHSVSINVL